MTKHFSSTPPKNSSIQTQRLVGCGLLLGGIVGIVYLFSPLIITQLEAKKPSLEQIASLEIPKKSIIQNEQKNPVPFYFISIPKIGIENAIVSTTDTDLSKHLVQFPETVTPPGTGTSIIFGHSSLPFLFNSFNYKTILSNMHKLSVGDTFSVTVDGKSFLYSVMSKKIVKADELSSVSTPQDTSYITLVTCTPPGTTWRRLIVKARLEAL